MTGFLEQTEFEGRIYSGGWTEGSGERLEATDKATDEVLSCHVAYGEGPSREARHEEKGHVGR
jgi:hypothetical protein